MFYNHWKKFALTLAAMFWTSCDDSSSAKSLVVEAPTYGVVCDSDTCMEIPESSGANDAQSSSSEAIASSSSEAAKPESSSIKFSGTHHLASDTNVVCSSIGLNETGECLQYRNQAHSKKQLKTETLLAFTNANAIYGTLTVPNCLRYDYIANYICSDGIQRKAHSSISVLKEGDGALVQGRDKQGRDKLYTLEEYLAEFPSSSSSEGTISSSSDVAESSSSFEVPVPTYGGMAVYCYNDTAVNDSGKVFDIIACKDGKKYLRFQNLYMDLPETQKELPEGVNPVPPTPASGYGYAQNCTREADICIDAFTIDENGNEQPIGGCYPSIECPEKPQT
ncbi:hypothetical protein [uncultured Fibrobacter sp.]|uniref:hypothetical protein n=1 Tax=uncultured Fibrobacter sp. TaxID=261512 RepID=UPI0025F6BBDD|nr:hypothetical protein [uncultured Fibrobacter sp.]